MRGIVSQDHDLEQMYFDSFMQIAGIESDGLCAAIDKLEETGKLCGVDFILSVSVDESKLPASLKDKVIESL